MTGVLGAGSGVGSARSWAAVVATSVRLSTRPGCRNRDVLGDPAAHEQHRWVGGVTVRVAAQLGVTDLDDSDHAELLHSTDLSGQYQPAPFLNDSAEQAEP